jgi:hypothetical protein
MTVDWPVGTVSGDKWRMRVGKADSYTLDKLRHLPSSENRVG